MWDGVIACTTRLDDNNTHSRIPDSFRTVSGTFLVAFQKLSRMRIQSKSLTPFLATSNSSTKHIHAGINKLSAHESLATKAHVRIASRLLCEAPFCLGFFLLSGFLMISNFLLHIQRFVNTLSLVPHRHHAQLLRLFVLASKVRLLKHH